MSCEHFIKEVPGRGSSYVIIGVSTLATVAWFVWATVAWHAKYKHLCTIQLYM